MHKRRLQSSYSVSVKQTLPILKQLRLEAGNVACLVDWVECLPSTQEALCSTLTVVLLRHGVLHLSSQLWRARGRRTRALKSFSTTESV